MAEFDDQELLAQFTRQGPESAFATLVARHVNLVYSVALRLTGNRHQAEEVTQAAFIILARKAAQLSPRVVLSGWLYQTARRTTANFLRGERRRAHREQEAYMQAQLNSPEPAEDWGQLAPLLDAAMGELGPPDRDALVLRFFEGRSPGEVGRKLGVSEAAAKMRVSRALDKLALRLKRRGITSTATALSVVLAAHAVQAAPAGLAASAATAALGGAALSTATTLAVTKTLAMTTLQKSLLTATLTVLAGAGLYEARLVAHLRQQNQSLQQAQAALTDQFQQLQHEREALTNRLAGVLAEGAQRPSDAQAAELLRLRGQVGALRQLTNDLDRLRRENQELQTQLAAQAQTTNQVSAEDQFILRQTHAVDAMTALLKVLKDYATNHNGQFPEDLNLQTASLSNLPGGLQLTDFEFHKTGVAGMSPGSKVILSLREPIPRQAGVVTVIEGGIDEEGVTHTEIHNVTLPRARKSAASR